MHVGLGRHMTVLQFFNLIPPPAFRGIKNVWEKRLICKAKVHLLLPWANYLLSAPVPKFQGENNSSLACDVVMIKIKFCGLLCMQKL